MRRAERAHGDDRIISRGSDIQGARATEGNSIHMTRWIAATTVLALGLSAALLTGCSGAKGTATGSGGAGKSKVWGYVVSPEQAQLEVDESQVGTNMLVVRRVVSPGPAWIVVHADDNGKPGERFGLKHIDAGESTDVQVSIEGINTQKVFVAVHADKAKPDAFDFNMMKKEMSPDRPYFVNRAELAKAVTVR